jgi:glycosyltransferase involved in cell wall biosynthesis
VIVVVTPARNEAENVPELHRRLTTALDGIAWRWLAIDDASSDETWTVLDTLARDDARVGGLRLATPAGSHAAILSGLRFVAALADVTAAAVLAGDLQDPPEALPELIAPWRGGAEMVFAARRARPGVPVGRQIAARIVHGAVRLALPGSRYPWSGTDMGLFGARALAALAADPRPAGNVFVRIARLGLPTAVVPVAKEPRRRGVSRWTAPARVRLARVMVAEALGRPPGDGPSVAIAARLGWAAG